MNKSAFIMIFALCFAVNSCGPAGSRKPGFEEIVDNLNESKNTKLHVEEYWKQIKGQELATSAKVVNVERSRGGAEVNGFHSGRPGNRGVNLSLKVPDIEAASKLKIGDPIKLKGTISNYRAWRGGEVVLYLEQVTLE